MSEFKYYKSNKVVTEHTTLSLVYSDNDEVYLYKEKENEQLFGVKSDNTSFLQQQHPECDVVEVGFDDIQEELLSSPQATTINNIVVNSIKKQYSYDEEIKLLNKGLADITDTDYVQYRNYVEECREHGREMKIKVGVKK